MNTQQLYCRIRKEWIDALPEERVRQDLIHHMVDHLGFPPGLLVVEKAIDQLPHLSGGEGTLPDRRVDILAYAQVGGALMPLLLIECKAVPLSKRVINQVLGYNHHIGASFIAIANGEAVKLGWYDRNTGAHRYIDQIPPYEKLVSAVQPSRDRSRDCRSSS